MYSATLILSLFFGSYEELNQHYSHKQVYRQFKDKPVPSFVPLP